MRPTNVAIVIPSLVGGGAERVAIDLANHWSLQSRDVTLITIDRSDVSRYFVHETVRRVGLGLMAQSYSVLTAIRNNRQRVAKLRDAIRETKATVVVSFTDITNITTLLACRHLTLRTVVCERTDPRHHHISRVWRWLRRRTYGRASALVVQTASVRDWAVSQGWKCPVVVIPNAAPAVSAIAVQSHRSVTNTVVALGRLSEEKGFHRLIEAFARIAGQFPDWQLKILGEGPARMRLEQLITSSQLRDRVHLPGWTADVEAALCSSDFLVLPSRYEGFPNALLEAMAVGLPCVSFDCESGPREIIRHGIDGLLVPPGDVAGLSDAMSQFMADPTLRTKLGAAARQVTTRFSRDEFYRRWDSLLDDSMG